MLELDRFSGIWRIEVTVPYTVVPLIEELFEDDSLAISIFPAKTASRMDRVVSVLIKQHPNLKTLRKYLLHVANIANIDPFLAKVDWLTSENWVNHSLASHRPIRVEKILIHGTHDKPRDGPIRLCIDAGAAFGTGRHGSTQGCLEAIQRLALKRAFRRPLDVGTGTGILAMAMARLFNRSVIATDNDPISVEISRQNIQKNGLSRAVHVCFSEGINSPTVRLKGPYDLIVMNLLFSPIYFMAPKLFKHLTQGSNLVLSGLLHEQARIVITRYVSLGYRLECRITYAEWETLVLRL